MTVTSMQIDDLSQLDVVTDTFEPKLIEKSKYYTVEEFHRLTDETKALNYLSVLNVNSRSLLKHFSEYETYFNSLGSPNFDCFDILSFTETWLDDNLEQLAAFEKYKAIFKHKVGRKEGGGIAIYIKEDLNYSHRLDLSIPSDKQHLFDCIFIEISSPTLKKKVIVGIFYRSPSFNSIPEFTTILSELLEQISQENKEVILLGDTNIDLLKYKSNKATSDYLDTLIANSYYPVNTLPTRIVRSSTTLIDHILKKHSNSNCVGGTFLDDISDHCINFILLFTNKSVRHRPQSIT